MKIYDLHVRDINIVHNFFLNVTCYVYMQYDNVCIVDHNSPLYIASSVSLKGIVCRQVAEQGMHHAKCTLSLGPRSRTVMWHVMYAMKTQQEDLSPDILPSKLLTRWIKNIHRHSGITFS